MVRRPITLDHAEELAVAASVLRHRDADRVGESGREELTVMVEVSEPATHGVAVKENLERRLREVSMARALSRTRDVRRNADE
jgi:hypothetical protein